MYCVAKLIKDDSRVTGTPEVLSLVLNLYTVYSVPICITLIAILCTLTEIESSWQLSGLIHHI